MALPLRSRSAWRRGVSAHLHPVHSHARHSGDMRRVHHGTRHTQQHIRSLPQTALASSMGMGGIYRHPRLADDSVVLFSGSRMDAGIFLPVDRRLLLRHIISGPTSGIRHIRHRVALAHVEHNLPYRQRVHPAARRTEGDREGVQHTHAGAFRDSDSLLHKLAHAAGCRSRTGIPVPPRLLQSRFKRVARRPRTSVLLTVARAWHNAHLRKLFLRQNPVGEERHHHGSARHPRGNSCRNNHLSCRVLVQRRAHSRTQTGV